MAQGMWSGMLTKIGVFEGFLKDFCDACGAVLCIIWTFKQPVFWPESLGKLFFFNGSCDLVVLFFSTQNFLIIEFYGIDSLNMLVNFIPGDGSGIPAAEMNQKLPEIAGVSLDRTS